jgi:hypothetical protein
MRHQLEATPRSYEGRSPRSSLAGEFRDDICGMHNTRCSTSSPLRDGDGTRYAGKAAARFVPHAAMYRDPTPDVRAEERSPDNSDFPKGRKVVVDKNAPSDHWMANPSSNIRCDIKYDWKYGQPELKWKRHVPSAIPVKAMNIGDTSKRCADPQGRPWVRQFASCAKNSPSDPWVMQGGRTDGSPPIPEDAETGDRGKRTYASHDAWSCSGPGNVKNRGSLSFQEESLSPRPRSDLAGLDSKSYHRLKDREGEEPLHYRATRRQYFDMHRNRPSDPDVSPTGAPAPGAVHWEKRTPRSQSSRSDNESRCVSPRRQLGAPGDRGLSPITGKRRNSYYSKPRVRSESPMWRP